MDTGVQNHPALRQVIAANVLRLRKERGWSQEKLARQTELSRETIRLIETGGRSVYIETLERIAVALGVDIADLTTRAWFNGERQRQAA